MSLVISKQLEESERFSAWRNQNKDSVKRVSFILEEIYAICSAL